MMRLAIMIVAWAGSTSLADPLPTKRAELAGTWTDDKHVYTVGRDGAYTLKLSDGRTFTGRWSIAEDRALEMTRDKGDVAYSRMLKLTTAADGTTTFVLAGPSYAFTATPRKCPCTTLVRKKR